MVLIDDKEVSVFKKSEGATFKDHVHAFWLSAMNLPPLEFAPLAVPLERRKQMAFVFLYTSVLVSSAFLIFVLIHYDLFLIYIPYLTYIYFDKCYERGGRPFKWFKTSLVWRFISGYFPIKLVKEVDLDPTKQYMFGYHPHGIMVMGGIALATDALDFPALFPGIELHPLTLPVLFHVPFFREIILSAGTCVASKKSINHLFCQGHSCMIVPGGVEESFYAVPQTAQLVLKNRKGFVQMAIKNGASLVPVYAFGENDVFNTIAPEPGSIVFKIQHFFKSLCRYCFPVFTGRTVFTYNYGIIPLRRPITVVVGPPLHVEKDLDPSPEKVDQVHQQYMDALRDLYNRNKAKYTHGDVIPELTIT